MEELVLETFFGLQNGCDQFVFKGLSFIFWIPCIYIKATMDFC